MELLSDKQALIDKVIIYGFDVKSIDSPEDLVARGATITKVAVKNQINLVEKRNSITIGKTVFFDLFKYSINFKNQVSVRLELSVVDDGLHNLNCMNAVVLRDRLNQIKDFLLAEYGITVDFKNAKFEKIEINKTIILCHPYQDYQRPVTLMMHLLPDQLRLKGETDNHSKDKRKTKSKEKKRSIQTYYKTSGKRGFSIKIYDKAEQLKKEYKIELNQNYLRFEITLNSSTKVKQVLGTNVVSEITDIIINNYFSNFINQNVVDQYKKHCYDRDEKLKEILKEYYTPNDHTWVQRMILRLQSEEIQDGNIPVILDINEITSLLGSLKLKDRRTKHRIKMKLLTLFDTEENR